MWWSGDNLWDQFSLYHGVSRGLNPGRQTRDPIPLSTEPSCWSLFGVAHLWKFVLFLIWVWCVHLREDVCTQVQCSWVLEERTRSLGTELQAVVSLLGGYWEQNSHPCKSNTCSYIDWAVTLVLILKYVSSWKLSRDLRDLTIQDSGINYLHVYYLIMRNVSNNDYRGDMANEWNFASIPVFN